MTAVVVGGGVAGLVAARGLALAGRDVVLLEAGAALGGRVARGEVAGVAVDLGAESFAVRRGTVAALAGALGLGAQVVEPLPGGAWVALADRTVPLPAGGVLGIPAVPLAPDVVRVLDRGGAARAYADRVLPPLRIGRYDRLGPLVRGRMGGRVLERLVAPVVESVYGADPEAVPVDAVAPQLNAAISTTGSLGAAVLRLRALAPAGSAVQSIAGGVHRLVEALAADMRRFGVDVRTGVAATGIERVDPGWTVRTADGDVDAAEVVLAADGAAAFGLLGPLLPAVAALPVPAAAVTRTVVLAVDDPRLTARPRGSGVLRAAGRTDVRSSALTHVTGKWGWAASGDRHLLRLSYRGGDAVPDAIATADARALTGVDLAEPVARTDRVWRDTAPPLAPETLALRRALDAAPMPSGLEVTGSWRTGTGLAAVVAGAEAVVARLSAG